MSMWQKSQIPLDELEHNVNINGRSSAKIRWAEVIGPGGIVVCARVGRSKSVWPSVVRRDISREQTTWIASINSTGLGEFLEREIAMRRVEELVEPAWCWCCTIGNYIGQRKRND